MRSSRPSGMDDTNEIIVESVTQSHMSTLSKSITQEKNLDNSDAASQLMNDSVRTPTIPLTNTRINPFANKSAHKTPTIMSTNDGEENNTPKSVLNMIEDKLIKRNTQSAKEKDSWKPSPIGRKLVKNKVSSGTPTIGSFFNN